tara:strand:- start:105 stop:896 length:792 start_codon:yes stop_codon:yes gene_type:complete
MSKRSTLELGLPTYIRRRAYKGKGISAKDKAVVQEAAIRKKEELLKRLKSKRFRERLAKQGIAVDDDVLKHAEDTVKATPVFVTKKVSDDAYGEYEEAPSRNPSLPTRETKHRRLEKVGTAVLVDPTRVPTDKRRRAVTRHELEHAFDESFKGASPGINLSQAQAPLLKKLGAKGQKDPRYSPEEIRADIMELRDEIGSEDVSAKQLKGYIKESKGVSKGNLPRPHGMIRRAMEANPGISLKDLAKLINSVAIRRVSDGGREV